MRTWRLLSDYDYHASKEQGAPCHPKIAESAGDSASVWCIELESAIERFDIIAVVPFYRKGSEIILCLELGQQLKHPRVRSFPTVVLLSFGNIAATEFITANKVPNNLVCLVCYDGSFRLE